MTQKEKAVIEQDNVISSLSLSLSIGLSRVGLDVGLFGVAGTGKTYILSKVIDNLPFKNILCVAVSHTAVRIMKERLQKHKNIITFSTLASFLNLRPVIKDDGSCEFLPQTKKETNKKAVKYDLIVFDECSQIGSGLKKMIDELTEGTNKVLVGDHHQTPPVGEELSPCFNILYAYHLRTPYRYEGDIQIAATMLAKAIDEEVTPEPIQVMREIYKALKDSKDVVFTRDFKAFMKSYVNTLKEENDESLCLVCYKNQSVLNANNEISMQLKGTTAWTADDLFIAKSNIRRDDCMIVTNYESFRATTVEVVPRTIYDVNGIKHDVSVYKMYHDSGTHIYTLVNKEDPVFHRVLESYVKKAKEEKNIDLRNSTWRQYYALKERFDAVELAYAVNSYTVQGGSYDNVYVNAGEILSVKPTSKKAKLQSLYTAATRAKKKLTLFL